MTPTLQELKALSDRATGGEWTASDFDEVEASGEMVCDTFGVAHDAAFIAASVNFVRSLLSGEYRVVPVEPTEDQWEAAVFYLSAEFGPDFALPLIGFAKAFWNTMLSVSHGGEG